MDPNPSRLERAPLVEAVYEVRFARSGVSAGDLLPGLLYGKLKDLFEKSETLPLASIPAELREQNEEFRFLPHIRLAGKGWALLIGERVLTISQGPPYSGWDTFRTTAQRVLGAVLETGIINTVERHGFKTLNLFQLNGRHPLDVFSGGLQFADLKLHAEGLRVRAESSLRAFTVIIDVANEATIGANGPAPRAGMLLSLDSLRPVSNAEFWSGIPTHIDEAHGVVKDVFFQILKRDVIESFGPTWT